MKKTISILLIVTMLLTVVLTAIPVGAAESASTSTTTSGSTLTVPTEVNGLLVQNWAKPWENESGWTAVSSLAGLRAMTANNKYYLTADIQMESGFADQAFDAARGKNNITLDGNGHKFIYGSGDRTAFSWADGLTLQNLILTGSITNKSATGLAPIAGHNNGGSAGKITLKNVWCDVDIIVKDGGTNGSRFAAGGIVMNATSGSSFTDVVYTGSITKEDGSDTNIKNIGGIVGTVSDGVTFTRCYVTTAADKVVPTITVNGKVNNVGGLVGNNSCNFVDCYSGANITVTNTNAGDWQCIGGIIGRSGGPSNYTNCKVEGSINYTATAYAPNLFIGGLSGIANGAQNATNCTVSNNMTIAGKPTGSYCAIGGYNGWSNAKLTYTNCVRGGTLDVNMNGWKATDNSFGIGGFIGYTNSSSLDNCTTAVGSEVKVTLSRASDCTAAAGVGGIYGRATGTIKNTTNNATVSAYGYVDGVGGIIGYAAGGTTINNTVNNGKVVTYGDAEGTGGIIGLNGVASTMTTVTNNGSVSSTGAKTIEASVGGFIGKTQGSATDKSSLNAYGTMNVSANGDATFIGCTNNSDVTVDISGANIMMAGFVGENDGKTLKFNGCSTAAGKVISGKSDKTVHIAGFCSYSWGTVKYNETGATPTVNASTVKAPADAFVLGGLSGYQAGNGSITMNNAINRGPLVAEGNVDSIGGLVANSTRPLTVTASSNEANIAVSTNVKHFGGIAGYSTGNATYTNVTNSGNITASGKVNNIAGIIAYVGGEATYNNVTNSGAVTVTGTHNGDWLCVSGFIGRGTGSSHTLIGCTNTGDISFSREEAVGQIFGVSAFVAINNAGALDFIGCVNEGDISVVGKHGGKLHAIGAYVGWNNQPVTINSSINNASIYHKGDFQYVAGFVGYSVDYALEISQAINIDSDAGKGIVVEYTGTANAHVGGILGYSEYNSVSGINTLKNVVNAARISASGTASGKTEKAGGIVGIARVDIINAVNVGKITAKTAAGIVGEIWKDCTASNAIDLVKNGVCNGTLVSSDGSENFSINYATASKEVREYTDNIIAGMDIYAAYAYDRLDAEVDFARTKLDKEASYVVSTWQEFKAALENAEQYYKMDKGDLRLSVTVDEETEEIIVDIISQAKINQAYTRLTLAIAGLVNKNAVPAYLEKTVADAESFIAQTEDLYFDEYWNALQTALNNATAILANPDIYDMDSDYINSFAVAIKNAVNALKEDSRALGGYIYTDEDFANLDGKRGTFYLMADITVSKALESFSGIIYGNDYTITLDGCGLFKALKAGTDSVARTDDTVAGIYDATITGNAGDAKSVFGKAEGKVSAEDITINVDKVSVAALFDSAAEDTAIVARNVITRTDAKYALIGEVVCDVEVENVLAMCQAEALVANTVSGVIANAYLSGVEYYTGGVAPIRKTDAETFASGEVAYNINSAFDAIILVQTFGEDALPVEGKPLADGSNVVVNVNGEYSNNGTKIDTSDIPERTPVGPARLNLEELTSAIAIAEGLLKDLYTEESWNALQTVLASAKKALESDDQAVIDGAYNALTLARVSLDKKVAKFESTPVDYKTLEETIAAAKALKEADYTDDSWATVKVMLAIAEAAKNAETQADVNSARSALNLAMINLKKVAVKAPVADTKVDTSAEAEDGCGSVIGGAAVAFAAVVAFGAGISFKKKED